MIGGAALCYRLFERVAASTPDAVAVVDPFRTMTYADLDAAADRLARRLVAAGVVPDSVVGVLLGRTVDFAVSALAVWKAGGAYLPLDPDLPRGRLREMAETAGAVAVVTEPGLRARIGSRHVLLIDDEATPAERGLPVAEPGPDDLAYVLFTSGSTGSPKCVAVSHRNVISAYRAWEQAYDLAAVRRHLQVASCGFDVATGDLVRALLSGGCLVMCPKDVLLEPRALYELMRAQSVEIVEFTPALLRPLVAHLRERGARLDFAKVVVVGGESAPPEDFRLLREVTGPGVRIINSYGLTEVTVDSVYFEVGAEIAAPVPIGRPYAGTTVVVLDDRGRQADEGELYLGGPQVARGYLGDPAATAARFVADPFGPPGSRLYRTGDLVRRLSSGDLVHLGRLDRQVKVSGVRVDPAEVEFELAAHPDVFAAAVVATTALDGVELAAYVVPTPGRGEGLAERVRCALAERLRGAAIPARITVVEHLPTTPNGKVDHAALSARATAAASIAATGGIAATASTGGAVDRIWAEALGGGEIDPDQNFFSLGGSSLRAASVCARVGAELGVDVAVRVLFDAPTLGEFTRAVRALDPASRELIPVDRGRDEAPIAPEQTRLWLLQQARPDSSTYNIPVLVRVAGALRVDILRRAITALVERHDALRTGFHSTPSGPVQRVRPATAVSVETIAADQIPVFVRHPFRLDEPPLVRAAVTEPEDGACYLVLSVHHIVFDGWSTRILLHELGVLYSAHAEGSPAALDPLPLRYVDFARWSTTRLASGRLDGQLEQWRRRLAVPPAPLALPRPARAESAKPRRSRVSIDPDLTAAVHGLANEHRTTLFVALLSVFFLHLHRWTRRDDIVVGVPFGDRDRVETTPVVGFFVNTVVVPVQVPRDRAFTDLLCRTRAAVAAGNAAKDIPFDQVVGRLGHQRPLVRAWFNLLGPPDPAPAMAGLATEVLDPPVTGSLFDINMYVTEMPAGLRIDIVHDGTTLDDDHACALLNQYVELLRQAVREPATRLSDFTLVTKSARVLLPDPGAALASGFATADLVGTLDAVAAGAGKGVAIRSARGAVTHHQLARWSGAIARRLRAHGIGPGQVVAVLAARSAALPAAVLAVVRIGAVFCLLDSAHPARRLAAQLDTADPAAVLRLAGAGPAPLAAAVPVIDVGDEPEAAPTKPSDTSSAGYVAFTSGSTGAPRAVWGGLDPVTHFLQWYVREHGIGPRDRFCLLSGLGHDPVLRDLLTPLWAGAVLCVPPTEVVRDPVALLDWLAAEEITVLHLTPALRRYLGPARGRRLPAVRLVAFGGDALVAEDVAWVRDVAPRAVVINLYGTTETPQAMSAHRVDPASPPPPGESVPIGRGIDGVALVLENAAGEQTGIGELGEIVVRTPFLTSGYLDGGSSGLTDDPAPGVRRYRTGDLGRYLPDGQVRFVGRDDDQVTIASHRVEHAEVDAVIRRVPGITDCATALRGGRLVAYLVSEAAPTLEQLRAQLRDDLPVPMLPVEVVVLDRLPLTPNGKLDRARLPDPPAGAEHRRGEPPRDGHELLVARAWRQVLGIAELPNANANFFDIGGSSLHVTRVHTALQRQLAREIPIVALFEHPTVRGLAAYLAGGPGWARLSRRPVRPISPDAGRRLAIRRAIRGKDTAK